MKRYLLLTLLFVCASVCSLNAQTVEAEKTYELTGKSKRGVLKNVEFDKISGVYTLYYVTKANDKRAKFQIYKFDRDFNYISMEEDEIEFDKIKTKYKWFVYKGETYVKEGLSVDPSLTGTLVLKRKRITYSYDWIFGGYRTKVEVLEKLKPKNDDGGQYFYHTHFEDDHEGVVYILAAEKDKGKLKDQDWSKTVTKFHILKFNLDLDLLGDVPITFEKAQSVACYKAIPFTYEDDPENPSFKEFTFIFAPMLMKGPAQDENKSNFTYVRFSKTDMKVVDRLSFNSPAPGWKIDEMVYDVSKDEVYYFGPSAEGKDAYWAQAYIAKKYKAVQLMKVSNHKIDYLTSTNLEEFEAKIKTPSNQKKSPAYEGKKFSIADYFVASNGDFFVTGQNFQTSDNGNQYKDVMGFHFSNKGVLKAQYGIDTKETNDIAQANGCPQFMVEGASGKSMYWFLREIDGVTDAGRLLTYMRVGKIDLGAGGISNMDMMGGDKKPEYFLDPNFPYLETDKGTTYAFFGADKKGKNIWFCRLRLD